jgi:hypothetical protein
MLHAGVPIPVVSRRLDDRRISTALDYYAHVTPVGDRFSTDVLQSVFTPGRLGTLGKVQRLVYYSND